LHGLDLDHEEIEVAFDEPEHETTANESTTAPISTGVQKPSLEVRATAKAGLIKTLSR
jgi:hypothetical protein